jgi:hypothetical protein
MRRNPPLSVRRIWPELPIVVIRELDYRREREGFPTQERRALRQSSGQLLK